MAEDYYTQAFRARDRDFARIRARSAVRRAETAEDEDYQSWHEPYDGHPLGHGMPTGASLRADRESHLELWKRILRGDPCAFCGERMFPCAQHRADGATVDHIVPRASGERWCERWTNFTGACVSCNGSKGARPLLLWMAGRSRQRVSYKSMPNGSGGSSAGPRVGH